MAASTVHGPFRGDSDAHVDMLIEACQASKLPKESFVRESNNLVPFFAPGEGLLDSETPKKVSGATNTPPCTAIREEGGGKGPLGGLLTPPPLATCVSNGTRAFPQRAAEESMICLGSRMRFPLHITHEAPSPPHPASCGQRTALSPLPPFSTLPSSSPGRRDRCLAL